MGRNSGKLRHEDDNIIIIIVTIIIDFYPGIATWFQIDLEMGYLKWYFEVPCDALTTMLARELLFFYQ